VISWSVISKYRKEIECFADVSQISI
jgi:hypothetical protein